MQYGWIFTVQKTEKPNRAQVMMRETKEALEGWYIDE